MVGKTEPITAADRKRFETLTQYCGCLCCLLHGMSDVLATVEHSTDRGRREGHQSTLALCPWHHFGHGTVKMIELVGPSLAHGRRIFEDHFGDENTVLVPLQDYVLELFAASPWQEYNMPRDTQKLIRNRWQETINAPDST